MTTYVAVVGSREFSDFVAMEDVLDRLLRRSSVSKPVIIVSGGATGADTLAERYAENHELDLEIYRADWKRYGKAAGPIRNRTIVERADLVVAFWDGVSSGTANALHEAAKHHKQVVIYHYPENKLERVKHKD